MIDTDDVAAIITAAGFTPRVDIPMPVKAGEVTLRRSVEHDNRYLGSAYRFNQRFDMIAHVTRDEAQVIAEALREMGIADLDENIDVAEPASVEEIGFLPWVVNVDVDVAALSGEDTTAYGLFETWTGVGIPDDLGFGLDCYDDRTVISVYSFDGGVPTTLYTLTVDVITDQTIIVDFTQGMMRLNGTWYTIGALRDFSTVSIAYFNAGERATFSNLYAWKRTSLPVKPRVSTSEMTTGKRFKSRVVHRIMMETRAESA